MDDAQKTPCGHNDFNSYVQNLRVFIFQNRRTDREIKTVQIEIGLSEYGENKKDIRIDGLLAKHQN
jgi:hypothetical protein